jgi:hypothetical protein
MAYGFFEGIDTKITIIDKLQWLGKDICNVYYKVKYTLSNWLKWSKTIAKLRPYEGFEGVLTLTQKHLKDYLEAEIKFGHSEETHKNEKIASVKECLEILERLQKDDYANCLIEQIDARYPKYQKLVTRYSDESSSYSGDFYPYKNGWVGFESGANPRRGYFEFINGTFESMALSDVHMVNDVEEILNQIDNYHADVTDAYKQALTNEKNDKKRLGKILNRHFFTWWD